MGSGKTSWCIDHMNSTEGLTEMTNNRWLYITPLKTEVQRIVDSCARLKFKQPETREHGSKFYHLQQLIADRENIVATHALFKYMEGSMAEAIRAANYTLVIDEVLDCASFLDNNELSTADRKMLFDNELVYVDDQQRVKWNYKNASVANYNGGRFTHIKNLCDNNNLISLNTEPNSSKRTMLLWVFPSEFLELFKEVIVMTYMFDGSPMKPYLQSKGFVFKRRTIVELPKLTDDPDEKKRYRVAPLSEDPEATRKAKARRFISVYDGRSNSVGNNTTMEQPLSKGWYGREKRKKNQKQANGIDQLNQGIFSFFKNVSATASKENAVVTFSDYKNSIVGRGFAKPHYHQIAVNAKATNDYAGRTAMAYVVNRFNHSMVQGWLKSQGVPVNDDLFAIAEMVQVVWRTAIRNDQHIHLYIPSERMRHLFVTWLNSDTIQEFVDYCEQLDSPTKEGSTNA